MLIKHKVKPCAMIHLNTVPSCSSTHSYTHCSTLTSMYTVSSCSSTHSYTHCSTLTSMYRGGDVTVYVYICVR